MRGRKERERAVWERSRRGEGAHQRGGATRDHDHELPSVRCKPALELCLTIPFLSQPSPHVPHIDHRRCFDARGNCRVQMNDKTCCGSVPDEGRNGIETADGQAHLQCSTVALRCSRQ